MFSNDDPIIHTYTYIYIFTFDLINYVDTIYLLYILVVYPWIYIDVFMYKCLLKKKNVKIGEKAPPTKIDGKSI